MRISEATVLKNADIPQVNKVDVPELNKFIVRKDDIHNHAITGKKTFYAGLQCNNLYVWQTKFILYYSMTQRSGAQTLLLKFLLIF